MPSYEEALKDTTTSSEPATTETSITNTTGNGVTHVNNSVDSRSYRNAELTRSMNCGVDEMRNPNFSTSSEMMQNGNISELQALHQHDVASHRRQVVQLPTNNGLPNDNIDMDETPTSDNSHSLVEGGSMMPLHVSKLMRSLIYTYQRYILKWY